MSICDDEAVELSRQTLCYVFREGEGGAREVLLGRKLRGFGRGRIMGLGSHVEAEESDTECAIREVHEESGVAISPGSVSHRAVLTFRFPAEPALDAQVAVFFGERWSGVPARSDEMDPQWFRVAALPLPEMCDDERYWLPKVLAGDLLTGTFRYDPSGTRVEQADVRVGLAEHP